MKTQKSKLVWSISIVVLLLLIGVLLFNNLKPPKAPKSLAIPVQVALVKTQDEPIEYTTSGTVEPLQTVSITPQVTGVIQSILFNEGQSVTAGQLLFVIDPASYQAAESLAKANLSSAQAQLKLAEFNQQRYEVLSKSGAVSAQEYQQIIATTVASQAAVTVAQAELKQAEIQLGYTQVKSPIAGRSGEINYKVGDVVTANAITPLVTINSLDPILASFNVPQTLLSTLVKAQLNQRSIAVKVFSEQDKKPLAEGSLAFIDNNVDSTTGTVTLKAQIANPNFSLWPGQLVTVHLILGMQKQAIVIPAAAVSLDQQGAYVYVVSDNQATLTRVTVDRYIHNLAVISSGLTTGEQVITVASPILQDGSQILLKASS